MSSCPNHGKSWPSQMCPRQMQGYTLVLPHWPSEEDILTIQSHCLWKVHEPSLLLVTKRLFDCTCSGAPKVKVSERKATAIDVTNVTVNCTGNNFTGLVWWRNDTIVNQDRTEWFYSPTQGLRLVIRNVRKTDAGVYVCEGTAQRGTKSTDTFLLTVYTVPTVVAIPSHIHLHSGQRSTLVCRVSGTPFPIVYWRKINSDGQSTVVASGSRLVVKAEDKSSVTNYTCVAKNVAGSESAFVIVTVLGENVAESTPNALSVVYNYCAQETTSFMSTLLKTLVFHLWVYRVRLNLKQLSKISP